MKSLVKLTTTAEEGDRVAPAPLIKANCPFIVKRSDLAPCVQRNISYLKDKRANPPKNWIHEGSKEAVCVVCLEIDADGVFWDDDEDDEEPKSPQSHRCSTCDSFFCKLCSHTAIKQCPACEPTVEGSAHRPELPTFAYKCDGRLSYRLEIPEDSVLVIQPVTVPRNQLETILTVNENHLHLRKRHTDYWPYRDDSESCIVCLEYQWTDTPDVDGVFCECMFVYCMPCVKALGIETDEFMMPTEGSCPTCNLNTNYTDCC